MDTNMPDTPPPPSHRDALFRDLLLAANSHIRDRSTYIQTLCRLFWQSCFDDEAQTSRHIDDIVKLLEEPAAFAVARLVLPELRGSQQVPLTSVQESFIHRLAPMMDRHGRDFRAHVRSPYEEEEREVLEDTDLYKLAIKLFDDGTLDDEFQAEIREWVRRRPRKQ